MKTFTPGHFATTVAIQCNFSNEADNDFEFIADEDEKMNEKENETEKLNTPKEKKRDSDAEDMGG